MKMILKRKRFETWEIIIFFFAGWTVMFFAGALMGNHQATKYYVGEISSIVGEISSIKEEFSEKERYLVGRLHAIHGISSSEEIKGEYYTADREI